MTPIKIMISTVTPADAAAPHAGNSGLLGRHAVFRRRAQLFGLGIDLVREVLPGQPLTRVPRSREQILGVLSLRGEILPVVVIDAWLGLMPVADDPSLPILVLRRGDLLVGLRVDAIQGVISVPDNEIQPHPSAESGASIAGIWQPEGRPPITLVAGVALLEALGRETALNS
jgi:chemotaxis signal transduction protein